MSFFGSLLESKRLGLLREIVPQTGSVGVLLNRNGPLPETQLKQVHEAARTLNLRVDVRQVDSERDFDSAFSEFAQMRAGAILIGADPFFYVQREPLIATKRRAIDFRPCMHGASSPKQVG